MQKLNELLVYDVGAMETYLIQAKLLEDWGFSRLAQRIRHEADDELAHVERQMERLIFLGGIPDLSQRQPLILGASPKEVFEIDLALEVKVSRALNEAIALCDEVGDAGTRRMLEQLLHDTEMDHIDWLETQLRAIDAVGIRGLSD